MAYPLALHAPVANYSVVPTAAAPVGVATPAALISVAALCGELAGTMTARRTGVVAFHQSMVDYRPAPRLERTRAYRTPTRRRA